MSANIDKILVFYIWQKINFGNGMITPFNCFFKIWYRYTISPSCDINFGPLVYGSKKSQTFIIENNGIFETHYTISCVGIGICPRARQG